MFEFFLLVVVNCLEVNIEVKSSLWSQWFEKGVSLLSQVAANGLHQLKPPLQNPVARQTIKEISMSDACNKW